MMLITIETLPKTPPPKKEKSLVATKHIGEMRITDNIIRKISHVYGSVGLI